MMYIALLRGINVGGHTVKMDYLRELFTQLGFTGVRSYIQSGNLFFETPQTDRVALTQTIEQHLHEALGYQVAVFLRTIPEIEQIVESNPFQDIEVLPDMRCCVVFTAQKIPDALPLPIYSPRKDMQIIATTPYEAFTVWYVINGRPPAAYTFKELGASTTTRFWHTLAKILQAAKKG